MTALRNIIPPDEAPLGINEAALHRALLGIFLTSGFGAVVAACHRQQKRIARENRRSVDNQGWIV